MNFFTATVAYCLYPFPTICRQTNITCAPISSPAASALKKYESRSWNTVYAYSGEELCSDGSPSVCKVNRRRVGDSFTWVQYGMNSDKFVPLGEDILWHLSFTNDDTRASVGGSYYALMIVDE
jgi:hypothetical protein